MTKPTTIAEYVAQVLESVLMAERSGLPVVPQK
jgi:hypothetical protein